MGSVIVAVGHPQDVYKRQVLNYVARIFSAGSSIVNNVVTIVNYFNKLEDLLPVIGEV